MVAIAATSFRLFSPLRRQTQLNQFAHRRRAVRHAMLEPEGIDGFQLFLRQQYEKAKFATWIVGTHRARLAPVSVQSAPVIIAASPAHAEKACAFAREHALVMRLGLAVPLCFPV